MKISIITPTLNQAKYIEDTILSVKNQDYPNFEHIIIDGGSIDGTIDILKKYSHLRWISEKDSGQSSAINKGFKMATGDILAWLNSDDYYESNIFSEIVNYFKNNKECYFLYGDITYVDENNKVLLFVNGATITYKNLLKNPDIVRQPSSFWSRNILNTIGYLNEELNLVMDYDFFLRIGKKYPFYYVNKNFSYYRYYCENKSLRLQKKQILELLNVMKKYNGLLNINTLKYLVKKYFYLTFSNFKK